jgi:hypothetical protein
MAAQSGEVTVHLAASRRIPWSDLAGVRVGIVLWGGLAALDVARLTSLPSYAALGAVALLVTTASVGMRPVTAVSAGIVGWLLVDGFVEHRYGVLGFDMVRDGALLALLIGLALLVTGARR